MAREVHQAAAKHNKKSTPVTRPIRPSANNCTRHGTTPAASRKPPAGPCAQQQTYRRHRTSRARSIAAPSRPPVLAVLHPCTAHAELRTSRTPEELADALLVTGLGLGEDVGTPRGEPLAAHTQTRANRPQSRARP